MVNTAVTLVPGRESEEAMSKFNPPVVLTVGAAFFVQAAGIAKDPGDTKQDLVPVSAMIITATSTATEVAPVTFNAITDEELPTPRQTYKAFAAASGPKKA